MKNDSLYGVKLWDMDDNIPLQFKSELNKKYNRPTLATKAFYDNDIYTIKEYNSHLYPSLRVRSESLGGLCSICKNTDIYSNGGDEYED